MSLKELICGWIGCVDPGNENAILRAEKLRLEYELKYSGIPPQYKERYFKYPVAPITYRGKPIAGHSELIPEYDVRSFIFADETTFKNGLTDLKVSYEGTNELEIFDSMIMSIARYLAPKIKYVGDKINFGFNEYWATPQETWALKQDDCEGSTNLFVTVMRNKGVPPFLIRNCCGITYSGGGHSTLHVLAPDLTFRHIECTKNKITEKSLLDLPVWNDPNDLSNIKDVWFSFNDKHSFHKFTTDGLKSWKEKQNNFVIVGNEGKY